MTADVTTGPPGPGAYDTPEGYATLAEPRQQSVFTIPRTTKDRVNGAVRYASDTGRILGIESQTDLLRVALHRAANQLEERFNDGHPFPLPESNSRGRGRARNGAQAQIAGHLPLSLRERVAGAVHYLTQTKSEVTSINVFVELALTSLLNDLEAAFNGSTVFPYPRSQLPKGRPPRPH